jgi:hypothetical protein
LLRIDLNGVDIGLGRRLFKIPVISADGLKRDAAFVCPPDQSTLIARAIAAIR